MTRATPRSDTGGAPSGRGGAVLTGLLRRLPLLGTLVGLGLAAWLVATNDAAAVATAFGRIGFAGLAAVVAIRIAIILLCGLAWARILDRLSPAPVAAFLVLRTVREGINVLLPVASVGGDVLGGRLLTFWGVAGALAAASILADMLIQVGTQALFAGLGAGLLMRMEGEAAADLAGWVLHVLAGAGLALTAFFALQRTGAMRWVEARVAGLSRRFVREAEPPCADATRAPCADGDAGPAQESASTRSVRGGPGRDAIGTASSVQDALDAVWGRARLGRLGQSAGLHLLAWTLGAAEIAVVLACIGVEHVGLAEVLVIEALSQAIKSAAFAVPSGLGVQEGGFIVVGALFGIDAGTALALSLAKRVPDVVLGLPALLVWQNLEARRSTLRPPSPS